MQAEFPKQVRVFRLDEWYHGIVFLKGSDYTEGDTVIHVSGRSCGSLNLTETVFNDAQDPQA
jgi:hypothetical protein